MWKQAAPQATDDGDTPDGQSHQPELSSPPHLPGQCVPNRLWGSEAGERPFRMCGVSRDNLPTDLPVFRHCDGACMQIERGPEGAPSSEMHPQSMTHPGLHAGSSEAGLPSPSAGLLHPMAGTRPRASRPLSMSVFSKEILRN